MALARDSAFFATCLFVDNVQQQQCEQKAFSTYAQSFTQARLSGSHSHSYGGNCISTAVHYVQLC
jgi:hypothetical protein